MNFYNKILYSKYLEFMYQSKTKIGIFTKEQKLMPLMRFTTPLRKVKNQSK